MSFQNGLLFILCYIQFVQSQPHNVKLEYIQPDDNLTTDWITTISQDSNGLLWFGTYNGLNKYDGYKFTAYRHDPDNHESLSNNQITVLYTDSFGDLWIGTRTGGLNKFNQDKGTFIRYVPNRNDSTSISSWVIVSIYESNQQGKKDLWICCNNGLNMFDRENNSFTHYLPDGEKTEPNDNYTVGMVQDHSGNLWVATWNFGIYSFNPITGKFTRYIPDPIASRWFNNKYAWHLHASYLDGKDILWMGVENNGLYKIDLDTGQIKNYLNKRDERSGLTDNTIWSICETSENGNTILWIGSKYGGIYKFNPQTEQYIQFRHQPDDPQSLRDNNAGWIYQDNSGVLWIATARGINKINPQRSQFNHLLKGKFITAIHETKFGGNDILWLGTKNEGLIKLDQTTEKLTIFNHIPENKKSLSHNHVHSIIESHYGGEAALWVGTRGGLNKVDLHTNKITQIFLPEPDPVYNIFLKIIEDKKGLIWLASQSGFLYSYDRDTEQFARVGERVGDMSSLLIDKNNTLWTGCSVGLHMLSSGSKELTRYRQEIRFAGVKSLYEDHAGILWAGTDKGLFCLDFDSKNFNNYREKDGLANDAINSILEDDHGNLWLSTNKGISKFNKLDQTFRNYDLHDGLQGFSFERGSYFRGKDGILYFGGSNGLNKFNPTNLHENNAVPPIRLTDFQIFNQSIIPGKDSPLNKSITETNEITLSYDQSVFAFEFAALDYHSPLKNKYAYQMEGVDPEWVYTDASRRFATYTQLSPGEYIFKVKGSNNDGLWNEDGTSVTIIIIPPWWRTNWAYSVYLVLIVFTLYSLRKYDKKRQRLKHDLELEQQHAENLEEVDRMKSSFFANISHEFRTPLTLIQGPVKQMLDGKFAGNLKEQYKMILRNSGRLLDLINQLLDLSKLESGQEKLQVQETDILKLIKGLVLSFSSLAERKKIKFAFETKENEISGYIARDKVEKIVNNLLSNAFKFTPEKGKVVVDVTVGSYSEIQKISAAKKTSPIRLGEGGPDLSGSGGVNAYPSPSPSPYPKGKGENEVLLISISNTGAGIPAEQLDKIFDRFYQVNESGNQVGSGIGLALTKELVEAHRGDISVESEVNKETTFTVILPIEKEHYKAEEIIERTEDGKWKTETEKHLPAIVDTISEESSYSDRSPLSGLPSPLLLIVEDNPDVASYISSFMENDFKIFTAENGAVGLKTALKKHPDLIISDVMMPEMDGFELCQKIKSDERISHIPVILLTAKADLGSRIEGLEFGADDYISKPFEADELKARSTNLIKQRRRLREKFARLADIQPNEIAVTSTDEKFLNRLMKIFEDHVAEPDFSTEQFAGEIGMSRSTLNRKLQALTNQSTHEFIKSLRLKRAAYLLRKANSSVAEVAYSVGFNNPSYFARAFRQQYGQSPSDYSNKNHPS